MAKTKKYKFGVEWKVYGHQTVEVPEDFTEEQAQKYVEEHWSEISLPTDSEYLVDSDEPDFESAEFEADVVAE